jgi:hypothetical protein
MKKISVLVSTFWQGGSLRIKLLTGLSLLSILTFVVYIGMPKSFDMSLESAKGKILQAKDSDEINVWENEEEVRFESESPSKIFPNGFFSSANLRCTEEVEVRDIVTSSASWVVENSIEFPSDAYDWNLGLLTDEYLSPNIVDVQITRFDNSEAPISVIGQYKQALRNPDCIYQDVDYYTLMGNSQRNLGLGPESSLLVGYDNGYDKGLSLYVADGKILLEIECYDRSSTDALGRPIDWNRVLKEALTKLYK